MDCFGVVLLKRTVSLNVDNVTLKWSVATSEGIKDVVVICTKQRIPEIYYECQNSKFSRKVFCALHTPAINVAQLIWRTLIHYSHGSCAIAMSSRYVLIGIKRVIHSRDYPSGKRRKSKPWYKNRICNETKVDEVFLAKWII